MHILAILGTVLAVLLFVLFRMQQAANAARDLADAADEARGFFRRWGWRRKHLEQMASDHGFNYNLPMRPVTVLVARKRYEVVK